MLVESHYSNHGCNGDLDQEIVFEFYDYNDVEAKRYIGEVSTTTRQLLDLEENGDNKKREFPILKKKGRGRSIDRGKLILFSISFDPSDCRKILDDQRLKYDKQMKKWSKDTKITISKDVELNIIQV